jgi:hypothetical protein
MNKLTGAEIIQKIKDAEISIREFAHEGAPYEIAGPNVEVYRKGGEGQGEDWRRVHHFTDHDVYLQVKGFYQSHYGVDFYDEWDCITEVKPQEKTITVYE